MQINDINTAIAKLTGLYDNLNPRWNNDPCATDIYQTYRQVEYHEIYEKLENIHVESLILEIIAKSIDQKILVRLHNLLNENINIYETKQSDFANVDFNEVYSLQEERLFADKFALLAKDKEDITHFPYPTEQERQMLLKENQTEKNLLENERSDYVRTNIWMIKNFYSLIYEISKFSFSIIESYFPIEKEKETKEIKPTIKTGLFFDMQLVSLIHNECSNIQFENLTDVDLYALLNLQPINAKLAIKSGEKTRMCYLIYKLYEYLKTDNRSNWRTTILESADIREDYYKSKYKEPVSEIPSRKSETFAQRIDRIFKELS